MPRRKIIFVNDYIYHLYNRGVEKRKIFQDEKDYHVFLEMLAYYLIQDKKTPIVFSRKPQIKISQGLSLFCFCLMPNHFHFLVRQKEEGVIIALMNALGIAYVKYFNKRYKRVGSLFQGRFQAKLVNKDEYLLQVSKYIHLNPKDFYQKPLSTYPYSSYRFYIDSAPKDFIDTNTILSYFSSIHKHLSYQAFVEDIEADFSSVESFLLD